MAKEIFKFKTLDDAIILVGNASTIKATYKSILRNTNNNIYPLYCDFPKFTEKRIYIVLF